MKRILMTADTVGGVWTYALDVVRALALYEVDVALATMGAPMTKAQASETAALSNLQVFESEYKLEWMQDAWADVDAAGDWLLDLEQELQPEVVHLNGYCHADLPFSAPVLAVCHSCVLSWWEAVKGAKAPPEWNEYAKRVRRGLQSATVVIAPSFGMLAEADRFYGPFAWSEVIPNSRARGIFRPAEKEQFVLAAGRAWDEAKNMGVLNRAAAALPCPVFLAGERTESFRNLIPLGRLSTAELASWFGRAAIYAFPAKYEPFGLSVLEAALSGCALVLGDVPSLRENWDGAALFLDPNDSEELRLVLKRLLDDSAERAELGRRALARAARFYPEQMGRRYFELYRQMIGAEAADLSKKAMVI